MATLRKAEIGDAPGIALVHVRSWQVAYRGQMPDEVLDSLDVEKRATMWRDILQNPDKIVIVAEDRQRTIIGFAALGASRDADANGKTAEVMALYVHPEQWRKGIGRALLSESLDQVGKYEFAQITLWVLETNRQARDFYQSFGFTRDGATKDDDPGQDFVVRELRYRLDLAATEHRKNREAL